MRVAICHLWGLGQFTGRVIALLYPGDGEKSQRLVLDGLRFCLEKLG
jgi:hypothetical protein